MAEGSKMTDNTNYLNSVLPKFGVWLSIYKPDQVRESLNKIPRVQAYDIGEIICSLQLFYYHHDNTKQIPPHEQLVKHKILVRDIFKNNVYEVVNYKEVTFDEFLDKILNLRYPLTETEQAYLTYATKFWKYFMSNLEITNKSSNVPFAMYDDNNDLKALYTGVQQYVQAIKKLTETENKEEEIYTNTQVSFPITNPVCFPLENLKIKVDYITQLLNTMVQAGQKSKTIFGLLNLTAFELSVLHPVVLKCVYVRLKNAPLDNYDQSLPNDLKDYLTKPDSKISYSDPANFKEEEIPSVNKALISTFLLNYDYFAVIECIQRIFLFLKKKGTPMPNSLTIPFFEMTPNPQANTNDKFTECIFVMSHRITHTIETQDLKKTSFKTFVMKFTKSDFNWPTNSFNNEMFKKCIDGVLYKVE